MFGGTALATIGLLAAEVAASTDGWLPLVMQGGLAVAAVLATVALWRENTRRGALERERIVILEKQLQEQEKEHTATLHRMYKEAEEKRDAILDRYHQLLDDLREDFKSKGNGHDAPPKNPG
jgi:hypothetical protein